MRKIEHYKIDYCRVRKMDKEIITFGEVEKRKFHHRKNLILLEYVDIENIKVMIFAIKSVIVLKKNFIANPSINENFLKTKIESYGDEATGFHFRKIPEAGSIYIC